MVRYNLFRFPIIKSLNYDHYTKIKCVKFFEELNIYTNFRCFFYFFLINNTNIKYTTNMKHTERTDITNLTSILNKQYPRMNYPGHSIDTTPS